MVTIRSTDSQGANVGGTLGLGGSYGAGLVNYALIRGAKENGTYNDSNGYMSFTVHSSAGQVERMRIQSDGDINITGGGRILSSGGIYLGTNNNVNLLDAYEEGSWTGTMLNTGLTTTTTGTYTRIGDIVYVQIYFAGMTINNAGSAQVSGLPFTAFIGTTVGYGTMSFVHGDSILNCKGGYVAGTIIYNVLDNATGVTTWATGSRSGMWTGTYKVN
jgi:hypothetical protein